MQKEPEPSRPPDGQNLFKKIKPEEPHQSCSSELHRVDFTAFTEESLNVTRLQQYLLCVGDCVHVCTCVCVCARVQTAVKWTYSSVNWPLLSQINRRTNTVRAAANVTSKTLADPLTFTHVHTRAHTHTQAAADTGR